MKPVLVLQHLDGDGPAYLATWLVARGVPLDVRNAEAGERYPDTLAAHGALAILGGEMSANDALPGLRQAEGLFLEALREGVPTLGHCLGGQLMARALGARVLDSPAPEVGFHAIELRPGPLSRAWLGAEKAVPVFQWHYEAFALPPGAQWLASNPSCPHQAFSIGPHLAMQFHIELDHDKLARWSSDAGERYLQARQRHPETVHEGERIRLDAAALMSAHQALAGRIFTKWLEAAR